MLVMAYFVSFHSIRMHLHTRYAIASINLKCRVQPNIVVVALILRLLSIAFDFSMEFFFRSHKNRNAFDKDKMACLFGVFTSFESRRLFGIYVFFFSLVFPFLF